MASLLLLLMAMAIIHTSMAIKCIAQPDPEESKKWAEQNKAILMSGDRQALEQLRKDSLQLLKTQGKVDCAKMARKKGMKEPTHCFSLGMNSCPKFVEQYEKQYGSYPPDGIFIKDCFSAGVLPADGPRVPMGNGPFKSNFKPFLMGMKATNFKAMPPGKISPETVCNVFKDVGGCTDCSGCNDRDYCNASVKGGPASGLFLLLLAIASGITFRWAAFH